jgi:hypothetical protein
MFAASNQGESLSQDRRGFSTLAKPSTRVLARLRFMKLEAIKRRSLK